MNLREAVENFVSAKHKGGFSQQTMDAYSNFLYEFADFMGDISVEDVRPENVKAFYAGKKKPNTLSIKKYDSMLKVFIGWYVLEGGRAS
jgi:hypothetical protein